MSTLRFKVVEEAFKKRPVPVAEPAERPSEYYGKYVFTQEKMRKYLPLRTYQQYVQALDNGTPLDIPTANVIAQGMKQWAVEMGVTHYTHTGFNHSPKVLQKNTMLLSNTMAKAAW